MASVVDGRRQSGMVISNIDVGRMTFDLCQEAEKTRPPSLNAA